MKIVELPKKTEEEIEAQRLTEFFETCKLYNYTHCLVVGITGEEGDLLVSTSGSLPYIHALGWLEVAKQMLHEGQE